MTDPERHELQDALHTVRFIAQFATGHHVEQPRSVLLHSLTVDIPEYAARAEAALLKAIEGEA